MHVGLSVIFQALDADHSDAEMWRRQLRFAEQAEPRGYDSLWSAEHHFTKYILDPNPAQFLTYMAAKTNHIRLGSHVFVLPWYDPVRLTEQIALLDNLSGGRVILAAGRGLGGVEFDGFRLEMGESRQLFTEYAAAISDGLESGTMEFEGELYKQPRVDIRPRAEFSFRGRTYASAVSPASGQIMAELGFGLIIIAQKPWDMTIAELEEYRELYNRVQGCEPPRPLLVNFTSIHEDGERAREIEFVYGTAYSASAVEHYDFTNERLAHVNGYEYYAALRASIEKRGLESFTRFLGQLQITGSPDEVVEQTLERVRLLDAAAVINVFSFGGMPDEIAQHSIDLYTENVLPRLQAEDTFRDVPRPGLVERAGTGTR